MEVILKRSTSQEKSVVRIKLTKALRNNTFFVFNLVGFINDNVLPLPLLQRSHADSNTFKRGKTYIKLSRLDNVINYLFTFVLSANQVDEVDHRKPFLKFELPVRNDSFGANNKMFAFDLLEFPQEGNQRNSLDCFTETHFICKHSINTCFVESDHPVQGIKLIIAKFTTSHENRGLFGESSENCFIVIGVNFSMLLLALAYAYIVASSNLSSSILNSTFSLPKCRLLDLFKILITFTANYATLQHEIGKDFS